MSLAPYKMALESVAGCFYHSRTKACFEFANDADGAIHPWNDSVIAEYPHVLFCDEGKQTRRCKILKTVAHVVIDENTDGAHVIEKWPIKIQWERPTV